MLLLLGHQGAPAAVTHGHAAPAARRDPARAVIDVKHHLRRVRASVTITVLRSQWKSNGTDLSIQQLQADGVHLSAADSQQNPVRRRGAEVQTHRHVRAHVITLFHCRNRDGSALCVDKSYIGPGINASQNTDIKRGWNYDMEFK